jgi:NNMT/PNMT/TEMT family
MRYAGQFFSDELTERAPVAQAIDIGSGTNLYPALLMLPFTERILLADHSKGNVAWLRHHVRDDAAPWTWDPFWREVQDVSGYDRVSSPRRELRERCMPRPGLAGIEQRSIFELPAKQWELGTMFFVAESITADPGEFREAVGCFVGALQGGAPFAAAFMGGSLGYEVGGKPFPALNITEAYVKDCFTELGVGKLSVQQAGCSEKVRDGYESMIVATGTAGAE